MQRPNINYLFYPYRITRTKFALGFNDRFTTPCLIFHELFNTILSTFITLLLRTRCASNLFVKCPFPRSSEHLLYTVSRADRLPSRRVNASSKNRYVNRCCTDETVSDGCQCSIRLKQSNYIQDRVA